MGSSQCPFEAIKKTIVKKLQKLAQKSAKYKKNLPISIKIYMNIQKTSNHYQKEPKIKTKS